MVAKNTGRGKKRNPVFTVSCSLIGEEGKAAVKRAIRKLGKVKVVNDGLGDCLIAGGDRCLKKIFAAVNGVPVVDLAWVAAAEQNGAWGDLTAEVDENKVTKLKSLLDNQTFFIVPSGTKAPEAKIAELVALHGGTVSASEEGGSVISITKQTEEQLFNCLSTATPFPNKIPNVVESPAPPPKLAGASQNHFTNSQASSDLLPTQRTSPPVLILLCQDSCPSVPPVITLTKEKTTIGRPSKHTTADVTIESVLIKNMISRKHATFTRTASGGTPPWAVSLTDEGSTNGFFVNGIKRKHWTLVDQDVVTLGGGGGIEPGWKADDINSDCVYRYHAFGKPETGFKNYG